MNIVLTPEQQSTLSKIHSFISDPEKHVFILKGAAGSGKTTLIKELICSLKEKDLKFQVMAPTGRAAKILRDKTGFGSTIHRGIYNFDKLESKEVDNVDESKKSFHYYFPLRIQSEAQITIVDEASMISDTKTVHELFTFGSGQLLSDLIDYANFSIQSSKLIFIGDEFQLPPVTDNRSKALDETYFQAKGHIVDTATLDTVHRQLNGSEILQNANKIRDILKKPADQRFSFNITGQNQVQEIEPELIASDYLSRFPIPEVGNGVVISYSNAGALQYNKSIREKLFPGSKNIIPGDVVLICNNNYAFYEIELYNGDMAKVVKASSETESRIIPVYIEGKKKNVNLIFRDIKIRVPHYDNDIKCKAIDSLLNSPERDLSIDEMKALYIDFCIRFNEEQKQNRENGRQAFKEGSEEFKMKLKSDPYFNAMKIKYGYAITCHKAQGGEWDTVYVDYSGRIGLFNDALRWCYTATTRAKNKLIGINLPRINGLQKLVFTPITRVSTVGDDYYQASSLYQTAYHRDDSHIAKRLKYHEITGKLENTAFTVADVVSLEYQEKYTFEYDSGHINADLFHKKSGIFNDPIIHGNTNEIMELKELLNKPLYLHLPLSYQPSTELFQTLYQKVDAICAESGIQITNIVEYPSKYYVLYFFKTSGTFSYIQFYYRSKGEFTTANPKSDIGEEDEKLQCLINQLK